MESRVLIVDDEAEIRSLVETVLSSQNCRCDQAENGKRAIELLKTHAYDLVISDARMPDMDGIEVLRWIHSNDEDLPFIMFTGHATVEHAISAMKLGAFDYLEKPFDPRKLGLIVEKALTTTRLKRQISKLRQQLASEYDFSSIIGTSRPLRDALDRVKAVADVAATVLLTGESGSGKELFARAIHYNGPRKYKAMTVVNCGAIP
ncbi:MAG: sigma-54-dependent Fis family transcriptional regulator, partial [Planctomycetes bacterium]|nr:sigma-54-dependent Fis family transcriptional regulator [Planctomycetota bacterium]